MLSSTEHEITTAHKNQNRNNKEFFIALKLSAVVLTLLKNIKMPTIIGILTFMSSIISCSADEMNFFVISMLVHWRHCFVSLSKTLYPLISTGSTQEDLSGHDKMTGMSTQS